jgi:hypothetical protein
MAKAVDKARKGIMVATFPEPANPEEAAAMATMALRPSVNAAAVVECYTKPLGEQDLGALVDSLSDGMGDVWAGDMKRAEAMLYGQAHALQAIFMNLARRASSQEYLKQWEAYLRMAMKAQNQCRMTLETLAAIKNPPVVFARQANINHGGQQQVNNGAAPDPVGARPAHAANREAAPTELLEATNGERMDAGATRPAGRTDQDVEAVGEVHRPANRRGQGADGPQRVQGRSSRGHAKPGKAAE